MAKGKVPKTFLTIRGLRGQPDKRWKVVGSFDDKGRAQRLASGYVNKEAIVEYHTTSGKWLVGVRSIK